MQGIVRAALDPIVHPVAVVDGSIQAIGLQTLDLPFTAGEITTPGAAVRLADTGPLAAGQYNMAVFFAIVAVVDANEQNARLKRRNAADGADIWSQRIQGGLPLFLRFNLLVNERIVVETVLAGSAGYIYQASIFVQGPF